MPSAKDIIKAAKEEITYAVLEAETKGAISESYWEQIMAGRNGITIDKMDEALKALKLKLVKADAVMISAEDYRAFVQCGKRLFRMLEYLADKGIDLKEIET